MSNIGFGTALKGNDRTNINIIEKVLNNYFINNNGYYLDTAERYSNIEIVGTCIKKLNLKRDLYHIIGKIYPITNCDLFKNNKCFPKNKENFIERVNKMIYNLGIEYFDTLMIHGKNWDNYDNNISNNDSVYTFTIMNELKQQGVLKNIGVSNYTINDIENIHNNLKIYPDSVQINLNLYNFDIDYINYCKERNIRIFCYGALSGTKYLENKDIKINYNIIENILSKYNCSEKELILSFMKFFDINPIISSSNYKYKKIDNSINIDDEDINILCSLHKPINICKYNIEKKTDTCVYIKSFLRPDIYEKVKNSYSKIWDIDKVANEILYNYDIIKILKKAHYGNCDKSEIDAYESFLNYLNTDDFLKDTVKNLFGNYLENNNEFTLDLEKIKMDIDSKDKLSIDQLQYHSRRYYKKFNSNKIDKNNLYTVVNYQNRTNSKGKPPHKDHEYRIFSLILYFCSNDVPTVFYDGSNVKNCGNITHKLYPKENCATIFLNNKHSIHAAAPNYNNVDRKTIYLSIISNLLSWKYVLGVNQ